MAKSKQDNVLEISPSTLIIVLLSIIVVVLIGIQVFSNGEDEDSEDRASDQDTEQTQEESIFEDPSIVEASVNIDIERAPYLGNSDNAKYAVVEFTDFQCPFCQRHSEETLPSIIANYLGDDSEVIYVFNDMPIYPPASFQLALAGLCIFEDAGIDEFMAYRKLAYDIEYVDDSSIFDAIGDLNINEGSVKECYENETFADDLDANNIAGQNAGVQGVPGFVVGKLEDGKIEGFLIAGAYPFAQFSEVLDYLKN